MREGPRLLGRIGHLIENDPAGFIEGDATSDQILGKATLETKTICQIIDGADPFALFRLGRRNQCLGIGLGIGNTGDRLRRSGSRCEAGPAGGRKIPISRLLKGAVEQVFDIGHVPVAAA